MKIVQFLLDYIEYIIGITWDEMLKVLNYFGFEQIVQGKTGGSRRKFVNSEKQIISLHEPHPQKVLKTYQLDIIIDHLKL